MHKTRFRKSQVLSALLYRSLRWLLLNRWARWLPCSLRSRLGLWRLWRLSAPWDRWPRYLQRCPPGRLALLGQLRPYLSPSRQRQLDQRVQSLPSDLSALYREALSDLLDHHSGQLDPSLPYSKQSLESPSSQWGQSARLLSTPPQSDQ